MSYKYEKEREDQVPVVGLDYCFLSKKDGDEQFTKSEVTVLTMKDRKTSRCLEYLCLRKEWIPMIGP